MMGARLRGEWIRLVGALKEWLGRCSGDDVLRVHGERDRWMGRMEVSYAIARGTRLPEPSRATAVSGGANSASRLTASPDRIRLRRIV